MRRAGPDFCWLGLGILVVLLVLAVSAPVMRERDQAVLLEGAVEMARSGDYRDHGCYNYDKQFLSYWALGWVIDLAGLDTPGADPERVVALGNRSAVIFFSGSLLLALGFSPRRGMAFLPVAMAAFLAPALIFSVPLLSSNIFSAGCLLLLAAAMRRRHAGWCNALLCAVLTAAAVGFRRDAALVLPLLCLLSTTRFSIRGLLRERRHWLMAGAAVGTALLGSALTKHGLYVPDLFFDARLFSAYLGFGLTGAALLLFWLPFRLATSRRRWFLRAATGGAMLLPFAFYAPFLYSPRHLVLSALLLLLVVILPRGERWWEVLRRRRLDRFVMWSSVLATLALWLIGFRFERIDKPEVVIEAPTLYPTADGFWPMGCYRKFLMALSRADLAPIDHNQEVWDAWTQVQADQLPDGSAHVVSAGLRAYGHLALKLKGRAYVTGSLDGDYELVADRSLGRARPGFVRAGSEDRREIDWDRTWFRPLGGNAWRQIYLAEAPGDRIGSLALPWIAQLAIVKALGPDDFHLRPARLSGGWFGAAGGGFRVALVFEDQKGAESFRDALRAADWNADLQSVEVAGVAVQVVSFVSDRQLPAAAEEAACAARWTARSLLPAFMSRRNYQRSSSEK